MILAWRFGPQLYALNVSNMFFIHYILMVAQQAAHPQSLEAWVTSDSAQAVQTKYLSYGEEAATHEVEEPLSYSLVSCFMVFQGECW